MTRNQGEEIKGLVRCASALRERIDALRGIKICSRLDKRVAIGLLVCAIFLPIFLAASSSAALNSKTGRSHSLLPHTSISS